MEEASYNISKYTIGALFTTELYGVVFDLRWFFGLLTILMVADFWFGCRESLVKHIEIRKSRCLRRTLNKFGDYFMYLIIGFVLGGAISDSTFKDNYHIDDISTCNMGCRFGAALFALLNNRTYDSIRALNAQVKEDGREVILTFNVPYPPLKLTDIINVPNYGFSIKNDSGDEIISKVEIYSGCQIKVSCSEDCRGKKITYAHNSKKNKGSQKGYIGVGGVEDSMDLIVKFFANDTEYPVANISPIFTLNLL